ncbi:MAG: fumarylacetoacetate hydrolase family protein [Aestuariivirga sp.]|uniref:2-keto-4-pentenoate hydratase n=1 Tax=Aestuariivirga sp. TaxID=2650926 RepID=UPI0025B8EC8D|nr:fumarylacetoacetate hydrolase family protein [Aestuariivirga sp.]MCA3562263.1 fumarylacetoacetate hydrolase family protein [Aestuariivirga sp.]
MIDFAAAADLLLKNWAATARIAELPSEMRPGTRAEGYDAAAAVAARSGSAVAGWKIAATSEAGQKHINVDGPIIGRILKSRLLPDGSSVTLGGNIMRVAEAEFAFGFVKDMPPRPVPYAQEEALDAVGSLHLSIEIPDSRYTDFTKVGVAQLIADTACASWLVLGPAVNRPWRDLDLSAHAVKGLLNGAVRAEGAGKAVLGDPRRALTWFVNEAATYCGGVKAGQFVTTGTCIVPMAVAPGDEVTVDYGTLGIIACRIA